MNTPISWTARPATRLLAGGLLVAGLLLWWVPARVSLERPERLVGWVLLGLLLFLSAFGLRKRLPTLSLGRAATWRRWHLRAGWAAILLFALHVDLAWPSGLFNQVLFLAFVVVAVSGVAGAWLQRVLPRRLAALGDEVLLDRIPTVRREVATQAEAIALAAAEAKGDSAVARLFARRLVPYLARRRGHWWDLLRRETPATPLRRELATLRPLVDKDEQSHLDALDELVARKGRLDLHEGGQRILVDWLLVHAPATWSLVVLSFLHVVLVHAFGAAR